MIFTNFLQKVILHYLMWRVQYKSGDSKGKQLANNCIKEFIKSLHT